MLFRIRSSVVLLLLPLFGCSEVPAPPVCRSVESTLPAHDALACVIKSDKYALLLENAGGLLTIPLASINKQQSEQCALHEQVWQQTGVNVEVGKLVLTTSQNMAVYECTQQAGLDNITGDFPSPGWTGKSLSWVKRDVFSINIKDMENRDHLIPLRDSVTILHQNTQPAGGNTTTANQSGE